MYSLRRIISKKRNSTRSYCVPSKIDFDLLHKKFYQNQYIVGINSDVGNSITTDLFIRLKDKENILKLSKFSDYRKQFLDIYVKLWLLKSVNIVEFKKVVFYYVELFDRMISECDDTITGSYHTSFAKDFIDEIINISSNTGVLFVTHDVDLDFLNRIRPYCLYPIQIMKFPDFIHTASTYESGPIVLKELVHKNVEGNVLRPVEMTFHDIGHAIVMNRIDRKCFDASQLRGLDQIREWVDVEKEYRSEYERLIDPMLKSAIILYIFDIVHDRGYQYEPILLLQQFESKSNLENIKTKISRNNYEGYDITFPLDMIDSAQEWLITTTKRIIASKNIFLLSKDISNLIIQTYPKSEKMHGLPLNIIINSTGIHVSFNCEGSIKTTSLYDIELLGKEEFGFLDEGKVSIINDLINNIRDGIILACTIDKDFCVISSHKKNSCKCSMHNLKFIEIYKLNRLFTLMKLNYKTNFTINPPIQSYLTNKVIPHYGKHFIADRGIVFDIASSKISVRRDFNLKYINLDPHARFVSTKKLHESYITNTIGKNYGRDPFVVISSKWIREKIIENFKCHLNTFGITHLEFGIIDTTLHSEIAIGVSSLLSRSIEQAKCATSLLDNKHRGYLPADIVSNAQLEYVSPEAVSNLWGKFGHRFVLSRQVTSDMSEIMGTILVSHSKNNLFFLTNKHNNISDISSIDLSLPFDKEHKWFDKFFIPELDEYKPPKYNQIANFVVSPEWRGYEIGKLIINTIASEYNKESGSHSQPLICGEGLFQIADPSWLPYMLDIGFKVRYGAETYYVDHEWSPLAPVIMDGDVISNINYNKHFGMPNVYNSFRMSDLDNDNMMLLPHRMYSSYNASLNPKYKLQYYQLYYKF